jgi:Tfp pilus assembly protein PilF
MGLLPSPEATLLAKTAAQRAIELAPDQADAHHALGGAVGWGEWDWQSAESFLQRALALNPNHAGVRAGYSHMLMVNRRWEEAEAQIERAMELDPLNTKVRGLYGMFLLMSGRYDDAISQFQTMLGTVPNHVLAHSGLWGALRAKGQDDEAVLAAAAFFRARGDAEAADILSQDYSDGGYILAMSRLARALEERSKVTFVPPGRLARIYVNAQDKENALKWAELAYEARDPNLPYFGIHPSAEFLLADPRLQGLLRRMNLPT